MPKLSKAEMYALAAAHGVTGDLARIMLGGAWAESKWDTEVYGDNGRSRGLFQLYSGGLGAGLTDENKTDPDVQFRVMVPEYQREYDRWTAQGYADVELAARVCCWAEKPLNYQDPQSAAANGYRAGWEHAAPDEEPPMPTTLTYDPETSPERQISAWACSIRTATWMLRSLGLDVTAPQMETWMVNAGLVSAADGLEDGSGVALATWLRDRFGLEVQQLRDPSWEWVRARAGQGPIGLGSTHWYHWVAVRANDGAALWLNNPAPNYAPPGYQAGIGDRMDVDAWNAVQPDAAIWIPVQSAEEDELSAEERQELDFLRTWRSLTQHEYADDLQQQHDALAALPRMPKAAKGAIDELANLANTLRQGGG